MRATRLLVVGAFLAVAAACGGVDQDPYWKVGSFRDGLESDLRRAVGPPTREKRIETAQAHQPCGGTTAERELDYDIPSRGAAKRVRGWLRKGPQFRYVVCVSSAGRIVRIVTEEID